MWLCLLIWLRLGGDQKDGISFIILYYLRSGGQTTDDNYELSGDALAASTSSDMFKHATKIIQWRKMKISYRQTFPNHQYANP